MPHHNDFVIALTVAAFAISLAALNVVFPWLVSAVMMVLGLLIGYGAIKLHFED